MQTRVVKLNMDVRAHLFLSKHQILQGQLKY